MELEMEMENLLDLSESEEIQEKEELEEFATLEIDPGLLLRNGHLSWLFHLVYPISMNSTDQALHFCINCSRYLASHEQAMNHSYQHQLAQGSCSHRLYPMIVVQCRDNELGEVDYYVSVQALREIQVPIGDVMSHVLHHPHPWLIRMSGAGNDLARYFQEPQQRHELHTVIRMHACKLLVDIKSSKVS
ncbi:unnamed protein product [Calypogeia fissa]